MPEIFMLRVCIVMVPVCAVLIAAGDKGLWPILIALVGLACFCLKDLGGK